MMNVMEGKVSEVLKENCITASLQCGEFIPGESHKLKCGFYKEESGRHVVKIALNENHVLIGKEPEAGNNMVRNLLVIRNKKSNKVRLVPVQNYVLSTIVPEEKEDINVSNVEKDAGHKLASHFGSKRHTRLLDHYARMQTDAVLKEDKLKDMSHDVIVDTSLLDTSNTKTETYLPPINTAATTLEEVYIMNEILTPNELEILKKEASKFITKPEGYGDDVFTGFYFACIKKLSAMGQDEDKHQQSVAILIYVDLLIKFLKSSLKCITHKSYNSCWFSNEIHKRIMNDFTVLSSSGRTRPRAMRDKVFCYIIALSLIANDFSLDLEPLGVTLGIPVKRLINMSSLLGAVNQPKPSSIVILKLPLKIVSDRPSYRRRNKPPPV